MEEAEAFQLTAEQKEALDKELVSIAANPAYVKPWDDGKDRFYKTLMFSSQISRFADFPYLSQVFVAYIL